MEFSDVNILMSGLYGVIIEILLVILGMCFFVRVFCGLYVCIFFFYVLKKYRFKIYIFYIIIVVEYILLDNLVVFNRIVFDSWDWDLWYLLWYREVEGWGDVGY